MFVTNCLVLLTTLANVESCDFNLNLVMISWKGFLIQFWRVYLLSLHGNNKINKNTVYVFSINYISLIKTQNAVEQPVIHLFVTAVTLQL